MIAIGDLRIGNKVEMLTLEPRVRCYTTLEADDFIQIEKRLKLCFAIPLTTEILKNTGFEEQVEIKGEQQNFCYSILLIGEHHLKLMSNNSPYWSVYLCTNEVEVIISTISHVHRLQNLFYELGRRHLEINL